MQKFAAALAFLLCAFHSPHASSAQALACDSYARMITSLPAALAVPPGTAAGAALGPGPFTLKQTVTNCSGSANSYLQLKSPFGSGLIAVPGVNGINGQATGVPTYTTSGPCPPIVPTQSATESYITLQGAAYSGCTVTMPVTGRYFLGTARIVGTQSISTFPFGTGYFYTSSCADVSSPPCATVNVGVSSSSGITSIPVYVAACAGVVNGTQTVALPTVTSSKFFQNPNPVSKTPFTISLTSCVNSAGNGEAGNSGYSAHVSWLFTACTSPTVICNVSGTSSVNVQILKSDGTTAIDLTKDDVYVLTDGTNDLKYFAAYINQSGGSITPGTVSAHTQVTVSYQ